MVTVFRALDLFQIDATLILDSEPLYSTEQIVNYKGF